MSVDTFVGDGCTDFGEVSGEVDIIMSTGEVAPCDECSVEKSDDVDCLGALGVLGGWEGIPKILLSLCASIAFESVLMCL